MFELNFTNLCLSTGLPWCVYMHVNSKQFACVHFQTLFFNAIHIFKIENLQRFLYCMHIHLSVRWFIHSILCKPLLMLILLLLLDFVLIIYFRFFVFLFLFFHYSSFLFSRFSFSVFDRMVGLLLMRYFFDVQFVEYTFVFCSSSFSFISTLFSLFLKKKDDVQCTDLS